MVEPRPQESRNDETKKIRSENEALREGTPAFYSRSSTCTLSAAVGAAYSRTDGGIAEGGEWERRPDWKVETTVTTYRIGSNICRKSLLTGLIGGRVRMCMWSVMCVTLAVGLGLHSPSSLNFEMHLQECFDDEIGHTITVPSCSSTSSAPEWPQ